VKTNGLLYGCGFLLIAMLITSCERGKIASARNDSVDYNLHIRPLFSDRCFKCHGPDGNQRKAHLRLDIAENAYAALKDNPSMHVIVPGNAN
jgi:mono/diheme cytochrome c family protein